MRAPRSLASSLLASSLLALCACSTQANEPPSDAFGPGVMVRVMQPGETLQPQDFEGVVIDIVPGVKYEARITTVNGDSQSLATINGHPFKVEGEWITIGPTRYGPVTTGDVVSIDEAGVHLNGQLAGPLPPRQHQEP
jgi:hypothetical protein